MKPQKQIDFSKAELFSNAVETFSVYKNDGLINDEDVLIRQKSEKNGEFKSGKIVGLTNAGILFVTILITIEFYRNEKDIKWDLANRLYLTAKQLAGRQ